VLTTPGQSLELAALVLVLLLVFCVFGPGRWALDNRISSEQAAPEAPRREHGIPA
jgi:hypothetical protein